MVFNVHFAKYIQSSCYIGKISEIFIKKGSFHILFGLEKKVLAKRKVAPTLGRKLMNCNKLQVIYKIAQRFPNIT